MKRAVVLLSVAALFLAGFTSAGAATIRKWSVEPTLYGALMKADADLDVDDGSFAGASLSLSILPSFQVEVGTSSFSTESESLNRSDTEYKQDMTSLRLIGTFLAEEDAKTVPFIAAGAGRIKTTGDAGGNSDVKENEATYGEVAMGARIFLWKDLILRPEIGMRHARTINVIGTGTTHANFYIAVGVSWQLFGVE